MRKRKSSGLLRGAEVVAKAAESLVPGVSLVTDLLSEVTERRARERMQTFSALVLGKPPTDEARDRFARDLRDTPFCYEVFLAMLEDVETEKVWAYAALFKGLSESPFLRAEAGWMLRFLRDATTTDLYVPRFWGCASTDYKRLQAPLTYKDLAPDGTVRFSWHIIPEADCWEFPHWFELLEHWGMAPSSVLPVERPRRTHDSVQEFELRQAEEVRQLKKNAAASRLVAILSILTPASQDVFSSTSTYGAVQIFRHRTAPGEPTKP